MNGAEVLQRIRDDEDAEIAQLPIIMLTGHAGEDSELLCLAAGADDFVTKPFDASELRARIRKTVAFAESVTEAQYEGAKDRKVSFSWAPGKVIGGEDYLVSCMFFKK